MGLQKGKTWRHNWTGLSHWAYYPQASAALPWVPPILSHQKVDLASDFQGVDPPASFVVLPLPSVARLLIVPASVDVLGEHVHAEDSV